MTRRLALCALIAGTIGCADQPPDLPGAGSLVITHASVLDVTTGDVLRDRSVIVTDGAITAVTEDSVPTLGAGRVIDARGRLLTPGFIDAHLHLCNIFYPPACTSPRSGSLRLTMDASSLARHRQHLASLYLPYGVTTVRDVGSDERVMPLLLHWMKRSSDMPDYYPVGADLISPNPNHVPAPWQVEVGDSAAAAAKVRQYHALGIRNIKLYWRLREPAFQGGLIEAKKLGMHVTGHVDFNIVTVDRALELGLRNFEHVLPWVLSALSDSDVNAIYEDVGRRTRTSGSSGYSGSFYLAVPEQWNRVGPNDSRVLALIDRLRAADASVTPTLHIFAQRYGLTFFTSPPRDPNEDTSGWTARDRERAIEGYRLMASYVKRAHDAGVRLNIGTDTPEPGKSVLSEMLLLNDAGIPMADVFRIATLDSARGIGHETDYGSIEPGKRANMVLFDGDPLTKPRDLLGGKTTIKDGVVYEGSGSRPR